VWKLPKGLDDNDISRLSTGGAVQGAGPPRTPGGHSGAGASRLVSGPAISGDLGKGRAGRAGRSVMGWTTLQLFAVMTCRIAVFDHPSSGCAALFVVIFCAAVGHPPVARAE
jgi:hypothetical protein